MTRRLSRESAIGAGFPGESLTGASLSPGAPAAAPVHWHSIGAVMRPPGGGRVTVATGTGDAPRWRAGAIGASGYGSGWCES
ncbi:hypothetical protein Slu03_23350 [Sediminihabitans luteus]|nr:hypothetical protein Slu03_23350 [Sediminihabitans luteus]